MLTFQTANYIHDATREAVGVNFTVRVHRRKNIFGPVLDGASCTSANNNMGLL